MHCVDTDGIDAWKALTDVWSCFYLTPFVTVGGCSEPLWKEQLSSPLFSACRRQLLAKPHWDDGGSVTVPPDDMGRVDE